jgi:hypothetical protein
LPIRNAKHRQNQLLFAQGVNSNYAQSRRSNFSGNQVEKKPLIII